jgi:hypothetical protein
MSSSFFSTPAGQWPIYRQQQQQANQGPAGSAPPATDPDLLDSDEDEGGSSDLGGADDGLDSATPQDPGGSGDNPQELTILPSPRGGRPPGGPPGRGGGGSEGGLLGAAMRAIVGVISEPIRGVDEGG